MALNVRRVVTANDANGKAVVWIDDQASNFRSVRPKVNTVLVWSTRTGWTEVVGGLEEGNAAARTSNIYVSGPRATFE